MKKPRRFRQGWLAGLLFIVRHFVYYPLYSRLGRNWRQAVVLCPINKLRDAPRLRSNASGYGGRRLIAFTKEMVEAAMERAKRGDTSSDLIPPAPVTQVYKILELLVAKDRIQLG